MGNILSYTIDIVRVAPVLDLTISVMGLQTGGQVTTASGALFFHMLLQSTNVRQVPEDRFRRRFASRVLDLVIWYEPSGSIFGFQLSYDYENHPRALTWTPKRGFSHSSIDDGEESVLSNRSPILRSNAKYDPAKLRADFVASADALPALEKAFVEARLAEAARSR